MDTDRLTKLAQWKQTIGLDPTDSYPLDGLLSAISSGTTFHFSKSDKSPKRSSSMERTWPSRLSGQVADRSTIANRAMHSSSENEAPF
jgi:hypothetical protein